MEAEIVLGELYGKGGTPKKGGTLASPHVRCVGPFVLLQTCAVCPASAGVVGEPGGCGSKNVLEGAMITLLRSGVAPANQTKERSVHELFAGAFRNKSSICESCLFSQGKTPEFTKMGEIHELSFWAFFWFGLPGRLLIRWAKSRDPNRESLAI